LLLVRDGDKGFSCRAETLTNVSGLGTLLTCYGVGDNDECLGVVYLAARGRDCRIIFHLSIHAKLVLPWYHLLFPLVLNNENIALPDRGDILLKFSPSVQRKRVCLCTWSFRLLYGQEENMAVPCFVCLNGFSSLPYRKRWWYLYFPAVVICNYHITG
jgi:hypothetical protein